MLTMTKWWRRKVDPSQQQRREGTRNQSVLHQLQWHVSTLAFVSSIFMSQPIYGKSYEFTVQSIHNVAQTIPWWQQGWCCWICIPRSCLLDTNMQTSCFCSFRIWFCIDNNWFEKILEYIIHHYQVAHWRNKQTGLNSGFENFVRTRVLKSSIASGGLTRLLTSWMMTLLNFLQMSFEKFTMWEQVTMMATVAETAVVGCYFCC